MSLDSSECAEFENEVEIFLRIKATITTVGPDTTREQSIGSRVFDNESGFHLFRRLPLEVGYKATVSVFAPGFVTPPSKNVLLEAGKQASLSFRLTRRDDAAGR